VADQILTAAQRGDLALPPLPALVTRLLEMLRDEARADLGQISELMRNDSAITTAVLRITNSAAFGGFAETEDLDQAIHRLGLRQVGMLVTSITYKGNFHSSNPDRLELLRRLWDHALVSALAARRFAGTAAVDRTEAYLAGLLHDAGKLVVLKGLDEIEMRSRETHFGHDEVEELAEALHAVLGFATLRSWKIADWICRVALHHHDSDVPADNRLLLRVQAADAIARKLCGRRRSDRDSNPLESRAIRLLEIGESELATLMAGVEEEVERARSLFE
jgi:HD-like signal output (HDOD) protein